MQSSMGLQHARSVRTQIIDRALHRSYRRAERSACVNALPSQSLVGAQQQQAGPQLVADVQVCHRRRGLLFVGMGILIASVDNGSAYASVMPNLENVDTMELEVRELKRAATREPLGSQQHNL